MSMIKVNVNEVINSKRLATAAANRTASAKNGIAGIRWQIDSQIRERNDIDTKLLNLIQLLNVIQERINKIGSFVERSTLAYQEADNNVSASGRAIVNNLKLRQSVGMGAVGAFCLWDGAKTDKPEPNIAEAGWKTLFDIVGEFGIVGGVVKTGGALAKEKDGLGFGKNLMGLIGGGAKLVGKMMDKTKTISPFGFGETVDAIGFREILARKLDEFVINSSSGSKSFSAARKIGNNINAYAKWGGVALTGLGNLLSNAEEYQNDFSNPRLYAETIGETAFDIGAGILVGAGVAAVAGATAPAWAVGAVSVGAYFLVDEGVKAITRTLSGGKEEKGVAEVVSDYVIDGATAVGKAVSNAGKAVASWFSKPKFPSLSW